MEVDRTRRFGVSAFIALLLLSVWVAGAYWSLLERQRIISAREAELAKLTVAVEEQTLRLFKLTEVSLAAAANWIEGHPQAFPGQDPSFVSLVADMRRISDGALDMRFVDAAGGLHVIPSESRQPVANVAERETIRYQLNPLTRGFYIGDPAISPIDNKWIVPVTLPVVRKDGTLLILAAILELDRTARIFEMQRDKPNGSITILKASGVTLFRTPALEGAIGKSIAKAPDFIEHLSAKDRGQYRVNGAFDGVDRLVSHAWLSGYPLIIAVTASLDDALIPWRQELVRIFALISLLTIVTTLGMRHYLTVARETRQRLADSAQRFHSLIEHAPEAILVFDAASNRVVEANPQAENLFERPRDKLLSLSIDRLCSPIQPGGIGVTDCIGSIVAQTQGNQSVVTEASVRTPDGLDIEVEARVDDMFEAGRRLIRVSFIDITDRKMAEQSLRRSQEQLSAILNSTTESIFQVDCHGIVLAVNKIAAQRIAKEPSELLGKCVFDFFPPEVAGSRRANLAEVCATGREKYTEDSRNDRHFSMNFFPILGADGKVDTIVVYAKDITERKQHQQRLENLLAEQSAMLENELVGIVRVKGRVIVWANLAFEQILGYDKGELSGASTRQMFPDEQAYLDFGAAAYPMLATGKIYRAQTEHVRKNGEHVWVDISGGTLDRNTDESLWAFVDITERRMLEQTVAQTKQRMELALAGADLGLWDMDVASGKFAHNPRLATMLGYEPDEAEVNDRRLLSLIHPDDARGFVSAFFSHLKGETPSFEAEYRMRHKSGHWVWILSRGKVVERNPQGRAIRMTGTSLDISERKGIEDKIRDLAFFDPLTNLPNRRLLFDRLGHALPASARRNTYGAILFIDLDNFKTLNDTLGHEMGDLLLIEVARQITSCVRAEDTVARLGGDEFVVVLEELSQEYSAAESQAKDVAEKIRKLLNTPYSLQGHVHHSTPSIGICLFKGTELAISELLLRADIAMYASKAAGRNMFHVYEGKMKIAKRS